MTEVIRTTLCWNLFTMKPHRLLIIPPESSLYSQTLPVLVFLLCVNITMDGPAHRAHFSDPLLGNRFPPPLHTLPSTPPCCSALTGEERACRPFDSHTFSTFSFGKNVFSLPYFLFIAPPPVAPLLGQLKCSCRSRLSIIPAEPGRPGDLVLSAGLLWLLTKI